MESFYKISSLINEQNQEIMNGVQNDDFHAGAERLVMPAPSESLFLEAICTVVRENESFVPPKGKGSLYIRPLLMGSGPILGLGPAPSFTFLVYAAAVGSYFKVKKRFLFY